MKTIKDKILNHGENYNNCKFVRCLNLGADLKNCIWEYGVWKFGSFANGFWKNGIWEDGMWDFQHFGSKSVWKDGLWDDIGFK